MNLILHMFIFINSYGDVGGTTQFKTYENNNTLTIEVI